MLTQDRTEEVLAGNNGVGVTDKMTDYQNGLIVGWSIGMFCMIVGTVLSHYLQG